MYILRTLQLLKYPENEQSKATFPFPCIKKSRAGSGMSHEIVVGNLFERKINLFYRAFLSR